MMATKKKNNHAMVRVPKELKERLERIQAEMMETYESGRGLQDIELADQGSRGCWIPLHAVIAKALDEYEDHKARSKKSSQKKTKTQD